MVNRTVRAFNYKYQAVFTVLKEGRAIADQLVRLPDIVDESYEETLKALDHKREYCGLDKAVYQARRSILEAERRRYAVERGAMSVDEFTKLIPPFNELSAKLLKPYPHFRLQFDKAPEWCSRHNEYDLWHTESSLYKGTRFDEDIRQGYFEYAEEHWVHAFCDELKSKDDVGERYAPVLDLFNMSGASVLEISSPLRNAAQDLALIGLIDPKGSSLFACNDLTRMALEYLAQGYLTRKR